jgi:hypothetical protein
MSSLEKLLSGPELLLDCPVAGGSGPDRAICLKHIALPKPQLGRQLPKEN